MWFGREYAVSEEKGAWIRIPKVPNARTHMQSHSDSMVKFSSISHNPEALFYVPVASFLICYGIRAGSLPSYARTGSGRESVGAERVGGEELF